MIHRSLHRILIPLLCAAVVGTVSWATASDAMKPNVSRTSFGRTPDGKEVHVITLQNAKGLKARIMTLGATWIGMDIPDKTGKVGDVLLGFDTLEGYLKGHPYFGSTVGRYANRIAKGKFTLDGKTYTLATNNGPNHLHGGLKGFDKVLWKAEEALAKGVPTVRFSYMSKDGEEGYPGNMVVVVTFTLNDDNELKIEYGATCDKPTVINLTNHAYFNLAGGGDILGHVLMLTADRFTPVDDTLIPTGELKAVAGSCMDFTKPMPIGSRIEQLTNDPRGYDHNYVLNSGGSKQPVLAARLEEPKTGRVLEILTTEPGIQFYSGNFLDGTLKGKGGTVYQKHFGMCLETDHFPDSPNQPKFPSVVLRPTEAYTQTTIHRFSVK
jgi:aldose 1-epimerase